VLRHLGRNIGLGSMFAALAPHMSELYPKLSQTLGIFSD
jgi:hypothetical protein